VEGAELMRFSSFSGGEGLSKIKKTQAGKKFAKRAIGSRSHVVFNMPRTFENADISRNFSHPVSHLPL
jgi:hypothetical protein